MAEHKFTPGPWCVSEDYNHDVIIDREPYIVVAQALTARYSRCTIDNVTAHANAQLIAAAPGLLEALKEFAVQHHCGCGNPSCNDCARDRMAADAIAKATGGNA